MTAATAHRAHRATVRPMHARFVRHIERCPFVARGRTCDECRQTEADASAESWRAVAEASGRGCVSTVEDARYWYGARTRSQRFHASHCRVTTLAGFAAGFQCLLCEIDGFAVDAASIASDMAVAEHYSGREPRGYWARTVPLG